MKTAAFPVRAKVWLYQGDSPWHFITIKKYDSDKIKKEYIWSRRGFGAIPVIATIKKTSWKTSIFPENKGTYLLPLKKEVRVKESIKAGSVVVVSIEVIT